MKVPVDSEPAPPEPGDVSVASSLALATTSSESTNVDAPPCSLLTVNHFSYKTDRGVPLVFASEADALTERKFVKALEEANLIDYYGAPQLLRLNVPNGDGEWIPAVHAWCPPVSKVQTTRQRAAFKTMIRKAMVAGIVRVDPLAFVTLFLRTVIFRSADFLCSVPSAPLKLQILKAAPISKTRLLEHSLIPVSFLSSSLSDSSPC